MPVSGFQYTTRSYNSYRNIPECLKEGLSANSTSDSRSSTEAGFYYTKLPIKIEQYCTNNGNDATRLTFNREIIHNNEEKSDEDQDEDGIPWMHSIQSPKITNNSMNQENDYHFNTLATSASTSAIEYSSDGKTNCMMNDISLRYTNCLTNLYNNEDNSDSDADNINSNYTSNCRSPYLNLSDLDYKNNGKQTKKNATFSCFTTISNTTAPAVNASNRLTVDCSDLNNFMMDEDKKLTMTDATKQVHKPQVNMNNNKMSSGVYKYQQNLLTEKDIKSILTNKTLPVSSGESQNENGSIKQIRTASSSSISSSSPRIKNRTTLALSLIHI